MGTMPLPSSTPLEQRIIGVSKERRGASCSAKERIRREGVTITTALASFTHSSRLLVALIAFSNTMPLK